MWFSFCNGDGVYTLNIHCSRYCMSEFFQPINTMTQDQSNLSFPGSLKIFENGLKLCKAWIAIPLMCKDIELLDLNYP